MWLWCILKSYYKPSRTDTHTNKKLSMDSGDMDVQVLLLLFFKCPLISLELKLHFMNTR